MLKKIDKFPNDLTLFTVCQLYDIYIVTQVRGNCSRQFVMCTDGIYFQTIKLETARVLCVLYLYNQLISKNVEFFKCYILTGC